MFAIQVAATGLSVYSKIQEGRAARRQAQFNREQYEFSAKQQELEALEQSNIRIREFNSAQSANRAFAAFSNRDPSDRSLKAFMDRQKEIAYSDVSAIESQALIEASQKRRLADMEGQKARSAIRQSYLGAASAIASGLYRYHIYKTPDVTLEADDGSN